MIDYQTYEKALFDWLMQRHEKNPEFTFSTRIKGSKGSELDYFIGTEKSGYFGFTLWNIPVSFPGSAGDVIDIFCGYTPHGISYYIQFVQTESPKDLQNELVLKFLKSLKPRIDELGTYKYESKPGNSMFKYELQSPKENYTSIEELLSDLNNTINQLTPIIDEEISSFKALNPEFQAHRITKDEFDSYFMENVNRRKEKYENLEYYDDLEVDFKQFLEKFEKQDLDAYLDFLREIGQFFALKSGDERLVFNVHSRRGHLSFTIGQRYCLTLRKKQSDGDFGFISTKALSNESEQFKGNNPRPWFTYQHGVHISKEMKESIFDAIKFELERSEKSGYRKFNKPEFEELILEKKPGLLQERIQNPMKNIPLNQILFGPPGTGKTYNTINYSLQILGVDTSKMQRDEIIRLFKEKVTEGQIVFTTFHQSMSYEEFIEGIKPQLENNNDSETANLSYTIENGIFKDLVDRIVDAKVFAESEKTDLFIDPKLFDQNVNKVSLGNSQDANDDVIYDYCMANDCIVIGFGEDIDFSGVTSRSDIRKRFQDNGFPISDAMDFNVSAIERLVLWMKPGQLVFVSEGLSKLKAIGKVVGDYYCDPSTSIRYSQFRRVQWLYKDLELPIKEIYGKTFSQQTIYQMDPRKIDQSFFSGNSKQEGLSNYVLIIDEINRGNVSSIFGELITLLETDKRKGECEELSVILPYSKRPFAIPNNLYIIGTMNTADRSVEALDTALRRRFSFVEMLPDASKLNGKEIQGINLELLLNTMNERIEVLVDRDHTIGHAFFMNTENVHDLRTAFGNKIIPLLQEYFYGNYQKMEMVIGSAFFKITDANKVKFAVKTEDFDADGKVYHILDVTKEEVISDKAFIETLNQLIQGV